MLDSQLDIFPDNLVAISLKHGEQLHQDFAMMEPRYQGRYSVIMLDNYR